jgi:hypothetical protein
MGWWQHPRATRQQLHGRLLQTGVEMSATGFELRFDERGVAFLREMVERVVQEVFEAQVLSPVMGRFAGVYISDSSRLEQLDGGVKVAARLELQRGSLALSLEALTTHDNATAVMRLTLPKGALHLGDLGFFDLTRFAQWSKDGVEWVTRYKAKTLLFDTDGNPLDLPTLLANAPQGLHLPVQVGKQRLPATLVAQPVAPHIAQQRRTHIARHARRKQRPLSTTRRQLAGWTLYLTSVADLSFCAIHTLYRARWQIERLFKRWKSLANLTTSTTADPLRRTCEGYAKLIAVLIAHWLTQALAWSATRLSLDTVFSTFQSLVPLLYLLWFTLPRLAWLFPLCFFLLLPALTLNQRRTHPNTFDLLALFFPRP